MRGFEPVASLTERTIRDIAGQRGFAVARLLTHWPDIVGEDVAKLCKPIKMSHRQKIGATLVLLTSGPYAPMIEMQLPAIREKVNACFGYNAVSRITITQTAATGFADGRADFGPATALAASRPPPRPEIIRQARQAVTEISDPKFRASLENLASQILSRLDTEGK